MGKRLFILLFLTSILLSSGEFKIYGDARPQVYFNHVYHVFDRETFADILVSDFIKNEFANADTGLPDFAEPKPETGNIYLRGSNTYLEILGVNNRFKEPLGKGGIAFAVDGQGELEIFFNRLNSVEPAAYGKSIVTRDFPNAPKIPWYLTLYRQTNRANTVDYWVTEYKSEFFSKISTSIELNNSDVSRARYLRQQYDPKKLLRDIAKISVALPQTQKAEFVKDLHRFGFTEVKSSNKTSVMRRSDFEISILEETPLQRGILLIEVKLNRRVIRKRVYKFGSNSKLTLKNFHGLWIF
jgi:hypothetical protein